MYTRGSSAESLLGTLNPIRGYIAYSPGDMPRVEVLVATDDGAAPDWAPGQLRMCTQHQDGSGTYTVQYLRRGRMFVDNVAEDRIRRASVPLGHSDADTRVPGMAL